LEWQVIFTIGWFKLKSNCFIISHMTDIDYQLFWRSQVGIFT